MRRFESHGAGWMEGEKLVHFSWAGFVQANRGLRDRDMDIFSVVGKRPAAKVQSHFRPLRIFAGVIDA
jgi:hypothetical protein